MLWAYAYLLTVTTQSKAVKIGRSCYAEPRSVQNDKNWFRACDVNVMADDTRLIAGLLLRNLQQKSLILCHRP